MLGRLMLSIRFILLLLLFCGSKTPAFAQDTLVYQKDLIEIGKYCHYFIDSSAQLSFQDISKLPFARFQKSQQESLNFGPVEGQLWIRFNVNNQAKKSLFLIFEMPNLDFYAVYSRQSNGSIIEHHTGGIAQPFSSRIIKSFSPTFSLGNDPKQVFVAVKARNTLTMPSQIGDMVSVGQRLHREDLISGIIMGVMCVMAFYNLFFFLMLRERMYLYYSLYVFSSCLVILEFSGLLYELVWLFFGIETGDFYWVVIVTTIFAVAFSMRFLKTRENAPMVHKILIALLIFAIVCNPLLFPNLSRVLHRNILLGATLALLYGTGWYVFLKGYKPARFFVAAWTVYLTGMVLGMVADANFVSFEHWYTFYAYQMGACAEAMLLSLALPDRLNYYRLLAEESELNRQRMSRDLHDDLGATLTSITYLGGAALKTIEKTPEDRGRIIQLLHQMIGAGKEATESMRAILWALNPENEESAAFLNKLITHFGDLLTVGSLKGDLQTVGTPQLLKLSAQQRRNLFMFLKESLQNILKHAQATRVDVRFYVEEKSLRVTVQDDGKGFETNQKYQGYGLKTMQHRAQELNGDLAVVSEPNHGTCLTLEMPIEK